MLYIETNTNNPKKNLAYEEYFLKESSIKEPIMMLWQSEPTVVIGRFQNSIVEVNMPYAEANNIHVVRRMTGGGTVYHDLGNLCYTFILRDIVPEKADFSVFAQPVIKALNKLGVKGEVNGRNDLTINGKKFSGTAMSLYENSLLFHGTLLYDSDMTKMSEVLSVNADKIISKGSKSVQSRVTNIAEYMSEKQDVLSFKTILKNQFSRANEIREYKASPVQIDEIEKLAIEKYGSWNWNFGSNPKSTIIQKKKYKGGSIEAYLTVSNGKIESCKIRGDFLGLDNIEVVENKLLGITLSKKDIRDVLKMIDLKKHFGSLQLEEIVNVIVENIV